MRFWPWEIGMWRLGSGWTQPVWQAYYRLYLFWVICDSVRPTMKSNYYASFVLLYMCSFVSIRITIIGTESTMYRRFGPVGTVLLYPSIRWFGIGHNSHMEPWWLRFGIMPGSKIIMQLQKTDLNLWVTIAKLRSHDLLILSINTFCWTKDVWHGESFASLWKNCF